MSSSHRDAEFSAFVVAQRLRMVQAATLLTGGQGAEAEDLVQTVLTRLYVRWERVSRVDDPVGYAMRSLANAFLDERRRAHRRREVGTDLGQAPGLDRPAADDATDRHDVRSVVLAALADLPRRQRAVVVLRHFLGYDVATTAELLGIADGTVKSQNAKALVRLRDRLGSDLEIQEVHL